jgi:hypothetical protein
MIKLLPMLDLVNNQIGEAIDFGTMLTALNLAYSEIGDERAIALILNRHVNEESYTSTMGSSTTDEEESSKDIYHTGKQEKRDIHITNELLPKEEAIASSTEPTTTEQEITASTEEASTTTTESITSSAENPTTDSVTVGSTPQKTTALKEELTTPKKNLTEKLEPIAAGEVAVVAVKAVIKKLCGGNISDFGLKY